jgi:hypothetical protein
MPAPPPLMPYGDGAAAMPAERHATRYAAFSLSFSRLCRCLILFCH